MKDVYICSTRRRKPGACSNTLALPMQETEDDILCALPSQTDANG